MLSLKVFAYLKIRSTLPYILPLAQVLRYNFHFLLNIHKYPVHLAIVAGYKYNPQILLKYLNDLADLDIGIKTGEKDKELALELFILSL